MKIGFHWYLSFLLIMMGLMICLLLGSKDPSDFSNSLVKGFWIIFGLIKLMVCSFWRLFFDRRRSFFQLNFIKYRSKRSNSTFTWPEYKTWIYNRTFDIDFNLTFDVIRCSWFLRFYQDEKNFFQEKVKNWN